MLYIAKLQNYIKYYFKNLDETILLQSINFFAVPCGGLHFLTAPSPNINEDVTNSLAPTPGVCTENAYAARGDRPGRGAKNEIKTPTLFGSVSKNISLAETYSPRGSRPKYHRRWRA